MEHVYQAGLRSAAVAASPLQFSRSDILSGFDDRCSCQSAATLLLVIANRCPCRELAFGNRPIPVGASRCPNVAPVGSHSLPFPDNGDRNQSGRPTTLVPDSVSYERQGSSEGDHLVPNDFG